MSETKAQHTQEPWVVGATGLSVRTVEVLTDTSYRASVTLAMVVGDGPEAMANTRLMASAPALLKALRDIAATAPHVMKSSDPERSLDGIRRTAEEAIRKALGA